MKPNTTTLERAFELARSGKYASVTDVKSAVSKEGYTMSQLEGPSLTKQLRTLIKAHWQPEAGE